MAYERNLRLLMDDEKGRRVAEALIKRPLKTEYLIWKNPDPKYAFLPNPSQARP